MTASDRQHALAQRLVRKVSYDDETVAAESRKLFPAESACGPGLRDRVHVCSGLAQAVVASSAPTGCGS
jgi:hypothetical protein